MRKLKLTILF